MEFIKIVDSISIRSKDKDKYTVFIREDCPDREMMELMIRRFLGETKNEKE